MVGVDLGNRRRAIRSLIARGALEEVSDPDEASGELLVLRLTFHEQLAALWRVNPPSYYHDSDTQERDTPCTPGYPMQEKRRSKNGGK